MTCHIVGIAANQPFNHSRRRIADWSIPTAPPARSAPSNIQQHNGNRSLLTKEGGAVENKEIQAQDVAVQPCQGHRPNSGRNREGIAAGGPSRPISSSTTTIFREGGSSTASRRGSTLPMPRRWPIIKRAGTTSAGARKLRRRSTRRPRPSGPAA